MGEKENGALIAAAHAPPQLGELEEQPHARDGVVAVVGIAVELGTQIIESPFAKLLPLIATRDVHPVALVATVSAGHTVSVSTLCAVRARETRRTHSTPA